MTRSKAVTGNRTTAKAATAHRTNKLQLPRQQPRTKPQTPTIKSRADSTTTAYANDNRPHEFHKQSAGETAAVEHRNQKPPVQQHESAKTERRTKRGSQSKNGLLKRHHYDGGKIGVTVHQNGQTKKNSGRRIRPAKTTLAKLSRPSTATQLSGSRKKSESAL